MPRQFSDEHRAKLRAAKLANPVRYWLGKKRERSAEAVAKTAAANRGKKRTAEHIERIRAALTGKKRSDETRARMRAGWARPDVQLKARQPKPQCRCSPEHYENLAKSLRGKPAQFPYRRFYYAGEAFRSTWEVRVATALDVLGIRWEYETKRFDLGRHTYAPDFYLPDGDCYWEVKGYYGPKSRATVSTFRDLYPDTRLLIVNEKAMKALERAALQINLGSSERCVTQ